MSGIGDDPPGTGEIDEDQEKEGNGAGNSTDTRKRSRSSPESEFKVIKKGKKEGCMSREELNKTMEMLNLHIYNLEYAVECNDKLTKTKKGEMNKDIVELKRITESLKAEMLSMIARSEVEVNVVKRLEVKMRTSVCNTIKQEVETSMKKILKEEMLGPVRNEDENMDISEDENQSQGIVGTVRNEIRTAVRELSQNRKSEDEGFQVVSYARVARGGGGSGKVKIPGVKPLPVPKQRKTFIIKPQEGNQDYKVPEDIKEGLKRNIRPGSLGMKVCRLVKTKDSVVVDMEQEETANMTGFIQQVKDLGLDCSEPGRKQPRIVIFDISSELQMEEMKRALCEQNRDIISTEAEEGIKPLYVYGKRTTDEIPVVSLNKELDIVIVQEPYTMRPFGRMQTIPGLSSVCKVVTARSYNRIFAGILIFKKDVDILIMENVSDEHIVVIECTDEYGVIIVVSAYFPPSVDISDMLNRLERVLANFEGENVIIGMDANAKSFIWGDRACDRGRKMEDFICQRGLMVVNDNRELPTFSSTNGESYIDLTITQGGINRYIEEWKVHEGEIVSDHRLITFNVFVNKSEIENNRKIDVIGFNLKRANWVRFEEKLKELFRRYKEERRGEENADIEERILRLNKVIIEAAEHSIPKKKIRNGKSRWWNRDLEQHRRKVRRARKEFQRNRRNEDLSIIYKQRYDDRKKEYKKIIKEVKKKSFEDFVEKDLGKDPWGCVYKIAAEKIKLDSIMTTVRKEGDTCTTTMKETLEAIMEGIVEDDRIEGENEWHTSVRSEISKRENMEVVRKFTRDELMDAVFEIKSNKTPGIDGIHGELLKYSFRILKTEWLEIINYCLEKGYFPKIWKIGILKAILKTPDKDPKDIGSRRPLTMLPEMGKVMERMMKKKIEDSVDNIVSENQYGFVKGRGTVDCMMRLMKEIDASEEKYVGAIFLDIRGAFNNLWWPAVIRACNIKKFPKSLVDLISSYLSDRKLVFRSKYIETGKTLTKGCPQGSILGPFIWNLVLDELLEIVQEEGVIGLAYADDICVIIKGRTRNELVERGRQSMEKVMNWMTRQKLKMSVDKCAWMLMKGKLVNPPTIARIYDKPVKKKDVLKYLGVMIDENRKFTEHVKYISGKMRKLMMTLKGNPIQATTELPQVRVLKHHYNTDIANPQNEPEFQLAVSACGRDEQLLFYGAAAECLIQRIRNQIHVKSDNHVYEEN
ncbi:hypothetical protein M8J76_013460 [Diaphorina citri]|nr:hypothetical protein M8J76_013460 [Diaphorina citri]